MIIELTRPNETIYINPKLVIRVQRKTVFMKCGYVIENLTAEETADIVYRMSAHETYDFTFDLTFD